MVSCPKCGRPVSGRARRCGFCGQSLVETYFSGGTKETGIAAESPISGGTVAATVLGAFGGAALFGALIFHILALFGWGAQALAPVFDLAWWVRTAVMVLLPVVYSVQQIFTQGLRHSFFASVIWLFCAVCGLLVTVQAYLDSGSAVFYGMILIPYFLVAGCALIAVSCITALLVFHKTGGCV